MVTVLFHEKLKGDDYIWLIIHDQYFKGHKWSPPTAAGMFKKQRPQELKGKRSSMQRALMKMVSYF